MASPLSILKTVLNLKHNKMHVISLEEKVVPVHRNREIYEQTRILDSSELYSGIIGRASVNFYAFNSNGNRGIACGLNNIQKLSDGTPLGGHSRAEDDFADLDDDDEDFLS